MARRVEGADGTRAALIDAGLKLFGARGFDSVSTRELADFAKANIGSISYHFGGKAGLYQACIDHVITTMSGLAAPILENPMPVVSPDVAEFLLEQLIGSFANFMVRNPTADVIVTFVLNEVMQPGAALDQVFQTVLEPAHRRICEVFATATGLEPDSEVVKIAVFSMMGMIAYFRIGRPMVLKRLQWVDMGPDEASIITEVLKSNLKGLISAHKKV